jgi:preprotein translocase subunit SecF
VVVKDPYDEKKLLTAPVIQQALGAQFQITGLDSPLESSELALMLRAGALAAPDQSFVEERTVGPSLGAENIRLGVKSVQFGLLLVVMFMVLYYRVFGLCAVVALSANLVLLVAFMSLIGATLTLPGIAGIVLTVGMAVDANVLIFSRIREELRAGLSPQMAIHAGFERAVATILDANITTLIVAVILYAVGTGPMKGFAVTLSVGILTSMFTAIMGTRALVNLIYGGRRVQSLSIGRDLFAGGAHEHEDDQFHGQAAPRRGPFGAPGAGGDRLPGAAQLNWGLDFTGGTLVEVHYGESRRSRAHPRHPGGRRLRGRHRGQLRHGPDVLIRLPQGYSDAQGAQMLETLRAAGTSSVELRRIEFVGPQVGDELREQGGLAMLLALGLVMLYIGFRFQFKFAVGAVVALIHDVLITLGFFSLTGREFDLTVLAALLAVIGYSLNDTIVVSDRIRENFRKLRRAEPVEVINISLTETLGRTLVTSLTTLLVLLALALFGGEMINGFAVALIVGVMIGTYSSIYVASNVLLAMGVSKEDLMIPVKEGAEQDDLMP